MKDDLSFETRCTRSEKEELEQQPHVLPIHATSSFDYGSVEDAVDVFTGKSKGYVYSRYANPTIDAVQKKIAELESHATGIKARGLMTSSGMSAIHTLLTAALKPGDMVITQGNLYGGTTELLEKVFKKFDIDVCFEDLSDIDNLSSLLSKRDNVKMIYFETPANPTLDCVDIRAITALARKHRILSCVDNTFATPYLQRPLGLGVDFIIHSTTKYLNGHGTGIAGAIVGPQVHPLWEKIWAGMKLMGTNTNAFDAWLVYNGIKTLPLRMDKQCDNALTIARFLKEHPRVERVNYPGLEDFKHHNIAKSQMAKFGAMLSFAVKGEEKDALNVINKLNICRIAPTLGDVDTLVLHPNSSSHLNVSKRLKDQFGITDNLIRLSVGIENSKDLINDLDNALNS